MRRRHKYAIGGFGIITIVFMVFTALILNGIIVKQNVEKKQLEEKISTLEDNLNSKVNEIATNLIITNNELKTQFSSMSDNLSDIEQKIDKIDTEEYGDFSSIIKKSMPSIFRIRTLSSQATGFIINENGYLATNAHFLQDPTGEITQIIQAIDYNNNIYLAQIIGTSPQLDIALLKINGNFSKLELMNSNKIEIGENIIAIGNPEGFTFSVTNGIVSATNRTGPNNLAHYIQTNTELNQGNSGGPLINKEGLVIGMSNFKIQDTEGMGFALESNIIEETINNISLEKLNKTLI